MFNWSEVHFYRSNFLQNPYLHMVPKVELFCSLFGRIEDTKMTFRNELTFTYLMSVTTWSFSLDGS
jgi:hypothetical protein